VVALRYPYLGAQGIYRQCGPPGLHQRLVLQFVVVVARSGQLHQLAPPSNGLDKGAIFGNELSFLSVCVRLFFKAFLETPSLERVPPARGSSSQTLEPSSILGLDIRKIKGLIMILDQVVFSYYRFSFT